MGTAQTNSTLLNRKPAQEIVLELLSFSGGENTIATEQEKESNEAEKVENWDSISLGGIQRSKGFTKTADGSTAIEADVHSVGTGLSDLTQAGTYTGTASAVFTILLFATGTPDQFKWKKGSAAYSAAINITGSAQALSDGVTVTFTATTGHTLNDEWTIATICYTEDVDLLIEHKDAGGTELYGVIEGDIVIKSSAAFNQSDANAFTSGTLCHGVSAGDKLWITNSTDNLKSKTVGNAVAIPTTVPPTASSRIYEHNFRLIAEGNTAYTVYGSVVGKGNWSGAGGWTTAGNAWSMVMPEQTAGCVPGFPSGTDLTAFTLHDTYVIYNQPNVARRRVLNGIGCAAPWSIAKGNEGIFFFSDYPTRGVFVWDGTSFINLTVNHDFIDDVTQTSRIFGIYKDREYWFIYNETGSGASYPNRIKIYNTKFGQWRSRPINASLAEGLGYPAIKRYTDNTLVIGSSLKDTAYLMLDTSDSDGGYTTNALYKTKIFSSRDFRTPAGYRIPIDTCRIKLISAIVTYYGTTGSWSLRWVSDRGKHQGSITFPIGVGVDGALLNEDFTVNTSSIVSFDQRVDFEKARTFNNSAVGTNFQFEIVNNNTGERSKIKKIKIRAILLDEV
jgi:hypothetical protein